MYCRYCGKEIDDDAKFCKYCGKNQDANSQDESDVAKNPYIQKANANASAQIEERLKKQFNIQPGTGIFMETTFHSLISVPFFICLIFELFYSFVQYGGTEFSRRFFALGMIIWVIILVLIVVTGIFYVRLPLSAFGITENRLLIRVWLGKTLEIPLDQIDNVTASKGIFKRADCGILLIHAQGQTYSFRCVACAETFKDALVKQMNHVRGS